MEDQDAVLSDWRALALLLESEVSKAIVGLDRALRLMVISVFARGHVLLEGDVGVGKTTLLRAMARAIGGAYERLEGTVDLLPSDLIYYTYIGSNGKPKVDPGPILKHGEALSIFFFNEVNRARPQVHSLLLRILAERSVTAFNREYRFPHLLVFADRNRIEKEETFELPSAARDRFLMEIPIQIPKDRSLQKQLMTNPRYHDVDRLLAQVPRAVLPYAELNWIGALIQSQIQTSDTLQGYAIDLCEATRTPETFGIFISDVDIETLILAGVSPRGTSMLLRASRVVAWLRCHDFVMPEDIQTVFTETIMHRVFFNPVYEMRRSQVAGELVMQILNQVATP